MRKLGKPWWILLLTLACFTTAGVSYSLAQGADDKDKDGNRPPPKQGVDADRPGPPPPRREDGQPPRKEDGPPPRKENGPPRDGEFRGPPLKQQGGPPLKQQGNPPRDGEFRGPPLRAEDGRRPEGGFNPGGPNPGAGRPINPPFGNRGDGRAPQDYGRAQHEGGPDRFAESDPEMFALAQKDQELDRECREAAEALRRSPAKEKQELEKKVNELVQTHFEVRQKRRELELKRVEEQLDRLRESIKTRVDSREEIVRRRVAELIGKPEDVGF